MPAERKRCPGRAYHHGSSLTRGQAEEQVQHLPKGLGYWGSHKCLEAFSQVRRVVGGDRFGEDEHLTLDKSRAPDIGQADETITTLTDQQSGLADGTGGENSYLLSRSGVWWTCEGAMSSSDMTSGLAMVESKAHSSRAEQRAPLEQTEHYLEITRAGGRSVSWWPLSRGSE